MKRLQWIECWRWFVFNMSKIKELKQRIQNHSYWERPALLMRRNPQAWILKLISILKFRIMNFLNFMFVRQQNDLIRTSLCNHVTLYGLASPRLLHSLIDHIKTSHSFKHRYSNGRWVVLYALVSPQWSHAWFRGRVRTILLPATKLYPFVNKLGGSM